MDMSYLIAMIGCLVGLAGWLRGREQDKSGDAEWRGTINAKLDSIFSSVTGIKSDVERLEARLSSHAERLAQVEASAKQAHKRIDCIEGRNTHE